MPASGSPDQRRPKKLIASVSSIVVAHLVVNIVHGLAHQELRVGLALPDAIFVIVIVLISPLLAMGLVWTTRKRLGLALLSVSMFGSLVFGLYHHFLAVGPDHFRSQPSSPWGLAFVLTAYGLLITEAIGIYVGVYFVWIAKVASNKVADSDFRPRWK